MSERLVVYHKPTCSKCRSVLRILRNRGVEFEAVDYYERPLTESVLRELLKKLGLTAPELLRLDEPLAKELGLRGQKRSDDELISMMAKHPDLIQRPIVAEVKRRCSAGLRKMWRGCSEGLSASRLGFRRLQAVSGKQS